MSVPPSHRAAAALILAGRPADPEAAPALVEILEANKVPLCALEGTLDGAVREAWRELAGARPVAKALEEEAARAGELLASWRRVERRLEEAGIRSVLFKSPRWFPALSSNLDVLVPPARFRDAAEILDELGHIRLPHYREDHKLLYRTFRGGRPGLSVHLHEMVSWGKVDILEGDRVVDGSVEGDAEGFRVSSPRHAMAITLAHTVFETDQIRLGDLLIVREAAMGGATASSLLDSAGDGAWEPAAAAGLRLYDVTARAAGAPGVLDEGEALRVEEILDRNPWARRRIRAIVATGMGAFPVKLPRAFSKEHLVRHLLGDRRREPGRRFLDLASSVWSLAANRLRVRTLPAGLIAVSGVDGAGKSSAAGAVASALRLCEVPTARVWTRGGFSGPVAAAKALVRRAAPAALPAAADEQAKRALMRSSWKRALWIWGTVLEQAIAVQRVRILLALGRSVVADRYVLDTLADLAARLPKEAGEAPLIRPGSLLLGAARLPDLGLLIDLPAEAAWRRKPDGGSPEARRNLSEAYHRVGRSTAPERIDGTMPEEAVAQQAVERSLRAVFSRFPKPEAGWRQ